MKTLLPVALLAAALAAPALTSPAAAAPLPLTGLGAATPDAPIVRVYGGCGPMGHRGPYGGCRPGGQWGGYVRGRACPPGFHLGPYGRRCWPNRY